MLQKSGEDARSSTPHRLARQLEEMDRAVGSDAHEHVGRNVPSLFSEDAVLEQLCDRDVEHEIYLARVRDEQRSTPQQPDKGRQREAGGNGDHVIELARDLDFGRIETDLLLRLAQ